MHIIALCPIRALKTHKGARVLKAKNIAMMTLGIGALGIGAAAYAGSKLNKSGMMPMKAKLKEAADKIMPM